MVLSYILVVVLACTFRYVSTAPVNDLVARDDGLVRLPLSHVRDDNTPAIRRRQDAVTLANNYRLQYLVALRVGTPSQTITLSLDTGSSDIWLFGPGSCTHCLGGICEYSH
jgi:hypothetical protein